MSQRLLLDASSLVYRAFFALPKTIADPHGRPVNAVRGFLEMTTRLVVDRRPARVVAALDDDWRPAFRVDAYAPYKAERPQDPPELPRQFDVLFDVLDALGLPVAIADGLEADDVIATMVRDATADNPDYIVTGDRDLVALVRDPEVRLLFTLRGVSELGEFDESAVSDKYGVPPRLYTEFAMLRGDPSDGLPGVPGIGPVRAARLLGDYGSISGVLAHSGELPHRQRAALEGAREYLEAMRTVVPMVTDAKVIMTETHGPALEEVRELAEEHGLGSSPVRLAQALKGER